MTIADLIDIARQAPREELPIIKRELAGALAVVDVRMETEPAVAQTVNEREPDYTVPEVAEILRVSAKKVYVMCGETAVNRIPAVKRGSSLRIPRAAFWAWKTKGESR